MARLSLLAICRPQPGATGLRRSGPMVSPWTGFPRPYRPTNPVRASMRGSPPPGAPRFHPGLRSLGPTGRPILGGHRCAVLHRAVPQGFTLGCVPSALQADQSWAGIDARCSTAPCPRVSPWAAIPRPYRPTNPGRASMRGAPPRRAPGFHPGLRSLGPTGRPILGGHRCAVLHRAVPQGFTLGCAPSPLQADQSWAGFDTRCPRVSPWAAFPRPYRPTNLNPKPVTELKATTASA